MFALTSARTVQVSLPSDLVRRATVQQTVAKQPTTANRPSFLVALLRALGSLAC